MTLLNQSTHQPFLLASIDDPVDEASTEVVNIDVSHLNGSNESQDDDSAELVRQLEAGSNKDLKVVHLTLIVILSFKKVILT